MNAGVGWSPSPNQNLTMSSRPSAAFATSRMREGRRESSEVRSMRQVSIPASSSRKWDRTSFQSHRAHRDMKLPTPAVWLEPGRIHELEANPTPPCKGGQMAHYVDGFVVPVPLRNLDAYRRMAEQAGKIWMEHGALQYFEAAGDDVKPGKVTSFPQSVQ